MDGDGDRKIALLVAGTFLLGKDSLYFDVPLGFQGCQVSFLFFQYFNHKLVFVDHLNQSSGLTLPPYRKKIFGCLIWEDKDKNDCLNDEGDLCKSV